MTETTMAMTYEAWKEGKQHAFDELPIHWAFSDEQFADLCDKLGARGAEDFARFPLGGFYLKKEQPAIDDWYASQDPNELDELLKDYDWAKGAFLHEMGNHEYHINWQADYDVISCFVAIDYRKAEREGYLEQTGWEPQTKRAYLDAQREFYRRCDENGWW